MFSVVAVGRALVRLARDFGPAGEAGLRALEGIACGDVELSFLGAGLLLPACRSFRLFLRVRHRQGFGNWERYVL